MPTPSLNMLSGLRFWKMNGLGNDFVIVDLRGTQVRLGTDEAQFLGDRDGPYGCDQIITLEEKDRQIFMGIHNNDGSAAEACGNAARCVAWLMMQEQQSDEISLLSPAGPLHAKRVGADRIRVDMGAPKLAWREIPLAEQMDDTRFIDIKLGPIDKPVLWGPSAVNMGNPHCIFFVDDAETQALERFGPMVEGHPLFPQRTNVSVAEVRSRHDIRLRVWERGVGITKACGTAACASLVAAHRRRLTGRKAVVHLDGGPLAIEWRERDDHVLLVGPTALEYEGQL